MLLIDLDTDVPLAIWNIFLQRLVVGLKKSYHIYFKVILSIKQLALYFEHCLQA